MKKFLVINHMDYPGYPSPAENAQRGLGLQCAIATVLGATAIISFSLWRREWPALYAARTYRKKDLPDLGNTLLGWTRVIWHLSDEEVLEYAGLDSYVYLMFYRAGMSMLFRLALLSVFVIAPLHKFYMIRNGNNGDEKKEKELSSMIKKNQPNLLGDDFWVYVVFTYAFTCIGLKVLREFTLQVVKVRQSYLGHQNSITDRTLRLTGIPNYMRSEQAISSLINQAFSVDPQAVVLAHDWSKLDALSRKRKSLIHRLERIWAQYIGPFCKSEDEIRERMATRPRPPNLDKLNERLLELDEAIRFERDKPTRVTGTAFITMNSGADCQMAAQALLSPEPRALLTSLAPAPHDVIWRNVYLPRNTRSAYNWIISFIVILSSAFLAVPLGFLAGLLDINFIKSKAPKLAELILERDILVTFVTEILPTFIFTFFNFVVPYFYAFLSSRQGYVSREDVELSTVSKNFFFVFVNLFLIYSVGSYISRREPLDGAAIAMRFAASLRGLQTFYTNIIVLQGIGLTPFRLMQAGSVFQFPFFRAHARSARDYHELNKPAEINYGILLPNALLIFILCLVYSILSQKILIFGAIYFLLGYFVQKYQCIYSMVHPQHSNGRLWTLITRRVLIGFAGFHIAMIGILLLQSQFTFASLLLPLLAALAAYWYDFEHFPEPLLRVIAVEAISAGPLSSSESGDPQPAEATIWEQPQTRHVRTLSRTLDEDREANLRYANPNAVGTLDGPWVAVNDNECIIANEGGFVRRSLSFDDWE